MKVYKDIVAALINANTREDIIAIGIMIDRAFEAEKLSWKDHEQLYALLSKIL